MIAARRPDAVETHPQCHRIAVEGEFDGLASQGLRFAVEQQLHSLCRAFPDSGRPPGRVAGLPLLEGPPAASPSLLLLFCHQIISHQSRLLHRNP
jgi:hypothetical protein